MSEDSISESSSLILSMNALAFSIFDSSSSSSSSPPWVWVEKFSFGVL